MQSSALMYDDVLLHGETTKERAPVAPGPLAHLSDEDNDKWASMTGPSCSLSDPYGVQDQIRNDPTLSSAQQQALLYPSTSMATEGEIGPSIGVDPGGEVIPWQAWDTMRDPRAQAAQFESDAKAVNSNPFGAGTYVISDMAGASHDDSLRNARAANAAWGLLKMNAKVESTRGQGHAGGAGYGTNTATVNPQTGGVDNPARAPDHHITQESVEIDTQVLEAASETASEMFGF